MELELKKWKKNNFGIIFFLLVFNLYANNLKDWPTFQHDNQRSGVSEVEFSGKKIGIKWRFRQGEHVWNYVRGTSIWSPPIVASFDSLSIAYIGSYDKSVYAINASSGEKIWRFNTGGEVISAPTYAKVNGLNILYVPSSDRTLYAIDAVSGNKLWSTETIEWNFTVSKGNMSTPLVLENGIESKVYVASWINDQRLTNNIQQGLVYCIDALNGKIIWKNKVSTGVVNSFSSTKIKGFDYLFITSTDGGVLAIEAETGEQKWKYIAGKEIFSCPSVAEIAGVKRIYFGTRFGTLISLNAETGKKIWSYKSGWWIESTPSISVINGIPSVLFTSYDRSIYCLNAVSGELRWYLPTGNYAYSSTALSYSGNSRIVFAASWDNFLYECNAASGELLEKHYTGEFVWSHMERGDSHWSSPAIASINGEPMIFFGSYDGYFYAFSEEGKETIKNVEKRGLESGKIIFFSILLFLSAIIFSRFMANKRDKNE